MSVNLKQFNEYKKIIQVCKEILKDKMEREAKRIKTTRDESNGFRNS